MLHIARSDARVLVALPDDRWSASRDMALALFARGAAAGLLHGAEAILWEAGAQ